MAQRVELICDRCGREIEHAGTTYTKKHSSAKITLWGVGEARSSFGQRIDLCPGCYEDFITFMDKELIS